MVEETEAGPGEELAIGAHWRRLVDGWAARSFLRSATDGTSISLEFDAQATGEAATLRFTTTTRLLVAFMTDGHFVQQDQLAVAAAASNAWNAEQLLPTLAVWDVRGGRPFLAGTCVLPLSCRMTQSDFNALADEWMEGGRLMFTRCHQVFKL
ncbi:hypothetical protein [Streptomyces sp. NPDC001970]